MDVVELRYWIGTIYITLLVLWIVIVSMFRFLELGVAGGLICAIPFIAFIISMYFADQHEQDDQSPDIVVGGFLTFCLLIVAILTNWNTKNIQEKTSFFQIIVIGVILIMFSMIEVWLPKDYDPIMKYYRSGLRILAVTLFIIALYKYYYTNSLSKANDVISGYYWGR